MNFKRFLFNFLAILGFALFGAKSYGMDPADTPRVSLGFADRAQTERRGSAEQQRFSGHTPTQTHSEQRGYVSEPEQSIPDMQNILHSQHQHQQLQHQQRQHQQHLQHPQPSQHQPVVAQQNIARYEGLTQGELSSWSVLLKSLRYQIDEYRKIEREYDPASNLKKAAIYAKIQKFIDNIKFLYQNVSDKQKNIIKSEVASVLSDNDVEYFAMIFSPFGDTYKFWYEYKTGRRPTIEDLKSWPKKLQDFYISKIKNIEEQEAKTSIDKVKIYTKRTINILLDAVIAYSLLDNKLPNIPLISDKILGKFPTVNLGIHAAGYLILATLINEKGFSLNKLIFTGSYLAGKAINKTTSFIGDFTKNITSKLSNARDYVLG